MRRLTSPLRVSTKPLKSPAILLSRSALGAKAILMPASTPAHRAQYRTRIDPDNGAGDATGIGARGEKHIGAGEIFGFECDVQRVAGGDALARPRQRELRAVIDRECGDAAQVSDRAAGGDAVDPDLRPQLHRQLPDDADHGMF